MSNQFEQLPEEIQKLLESGGDDSFADGAVGVLGQGELSGAGQPGPFEFEEFAAPSSRSFDDVSDRSEIHVRIELGRCWLTPDEVAQLHEGSIVELDKRNGELVDVWAGGRRIARGEVQTLNGNFCIKVIEMAGRG